MSDHWRQLQEITTTVDRQTTTEEITPHRCLTHSDITLQELIRGDH